jgi:hypothetical protein
MDRRHVGHGEDKSGLPVAAADDRHLLGLTGPVGLERGQGGWVECQRSAALGCLGVGLHNGVVDDHPWAAGSNPAGSKVNIKPTQPGELGTS